MADRISVVSVMEAEFVTGPAKNVLEFAIRARSGTPRIDLAVIAYHRGTDKNLVENRFVQAAEQAGVAVDVIFERHAFDFAILPQLTAAVERREPAVVQTHNVKSHFLMRYSGLCRKYPWIAFHHGYTTTDLKMRAYNQLDRWSLRSAAHLVTVCGPFRKQLERQGVFPDRITVQHNAIGPFMPPSPEETLAVRRQIPADTGVPLLLMVSRLSHEKGHADALRAFAILNGRGANFHAIIVGEGPERRRIERLRERFGLTEKVTLAGLRHDVRPYFAGASIFLMPSHSEGSPNALLEAMAAGTPVIASEVGGIPEIVISGETGILVPAKNSPALADAIETLLRDPAAASRLAENARADAARWTYDAYHRSLAAIYEQVLREPAQPGY